MGKLAQTTVTVDGSATKTTPPLLGVLKSISCFSEHKAQVVVWFVDYPERIIINETVTGPQKYYPMAVARAPTSDFYNPHAFTEYVLNGKLGVKVVGPKNNTVKVNIVFDGG